MNQSQEDFLTAVVAKMLENTAAAFGQPIAIQDVEWQVVYDLKEQVADSLRTLGVTNI